MDERDEGRRHLGRVGRRRRQQTDDRLGEPEPRADAIELLAEEGGGAERERGGGEEDEDGEWWRHWWLTESLLFRYSRHT